MFVCCFWAMVPHAKLFVQVPSAVWYCEDTLISLSLCHNFITSLPAAIGRLHRLKRLILRHNNLGQLKGDKMKSKVLPTIPPELANCTDLRVLDLSFNSLGPLLPEDWPPTQLRRLEVLGLASNGLQDLPNSFARMRCSLRTLSTHGNPLPPELLTRLRVRLARGAPNRTRGEDDAHDSGTVVLTTLEWLATRPVCADQQRGKQRHIESNMILSRSASGAGGGAKVRELIHEKAGTNTKHSGNYTHDETNKMIGTT